MGCEQSRCVARTDGEIEIGLGVPPSSLPLVKIPQKETPIKSHKDAGHNNINSLQTKDTDSSPIGPQKSYTQNANYATNSTAPNDESSKTAKTEFSTTLLNTCVKLSNTGALLYTNEIDMRIGKSAEELESDFAILSETIMNIMKDCKYGKVQVNSVEAVLSKWRTKVYDEIAKKTGEIQSTIAFNSLLTSFYIKHEVSGWAYDDTLINFCRDNNLKYDPQFISSNQRKIHDMPSLTASVGLEIVLVGRVSVESYVSFDSIKHFTKENLDSILQGNCEKDNISIWFDAHTPIPIDFGYTLNSRLQTNEFSLGFYIFDGSARMNLKRAMSAFQSYGAELNAEQIALLKKIPSEELRIYFYINENGISKISLNIQRLSSELVEAMLATFTKSNVRKKQLDTQIEEFKASGDLQFYLEFSTEGYQFGFESKVGKEFGSMIYIESPI